MTGTPNKASFHHMKDGTLEDWQAIAAEMRPFQAGLADRMLDHLRVL